MGGPHRSRGRRARGRGVHPALVAVLVVALTTVGASGGVLWLAAHLLPHVVAADGEDAPMADVVEILKVALAVGLSRWTGTA